MASPTLYEGLGGNRHRHGADPLIGLAITLVILRITWESWRTVRGHEHAH